MTSSAASMGQSGLPAGWKWGKLGDVCEINPRRPSSFTSKDEGAASFVPMASVSEQARGVVEPEIRPFGEIKKGYSYFQEDDVLFAKITPCMENGKHAITRGLIGGFGFGSTEFHVLRVRESVISDWVYKFVTQPFVSKEAEANFTGTAGQRRVPKEFLDSLLVPIPSRTKAHCWDIESGR